ncbi:Putative ABC transporter nucleotide binding/ATPase protein [Bradyrhizobium sp. ORS 278]|uniref:ABC transporter ATP-binding protein n=1 Tax=Bradyrhizobium sp. (strain ORS 278) TaxID=114615 RepID=UPI0001507646|nr:ABC transporter ATP-binding protein [Bradyrhizobium sp. ORS 278]CAL76438.1 Putative ABC transporter nucleotide binding/ATPase protein [Bradyrhizobium sp. ORS 278]
MTAPLLQIEGLGIASAAGTPIVDGISLEIGRGEFLAVVGESGSGKTAAARAVLGLLPAGLVRSQGRILLDGEDLTRLSQRQLRALRGPAIGMVFQEPMVSLNPALTIGAQMMEGLLLHERLARKEARRRCLDMLARVQIRDPLRTFSAYPHEFSGGMRQRIMLASVMLLRPKLLIADEPTTALDTLTQREVLDLMVALARDHGTAVMLITHNLGLVARYAQRAVVMCRGRMVETGTAQQILTAPRASYTRELVEALPRRAAARRAAAADDLIMAVRGLKVTFPGRQRLFRRDAGLMAVNGVDLSIRAGETVAVVGGSGSGKTTLGRAMLRLLPLAGGEVHFLGRDVTSAIDADFRLAAQLVFQDPYSSLDPRMRIGDIVAEPLRHTSLTTAERAGRVTTMLEEVGLSGLAQRWPHELSGGQRQRVAIARAIIRRPAFVVADEPVSALDMTIQAQVLKLFERLQAQYGFACLFISHDLAAVEQVADRVVVMQAGQIVEQGSRDDVFDRPQHDYTKALLAAAPIVAFSDREPAPA